MSTLVIMRGLPASGKTTYARTWVEKDITHRVRVNRDDLRKMLDKSSYIKGVTEPRVVRVRNAVILDALKAGLDVISDDTNLPSSTVKDLLKLADKANANYKIVDFTNVSYDTCIARNMHYDRVDRGESISNSVITDMYTRFIQGKEYPLSVPVSHATGGLDLYPYSPLPGSVPAVIVDIDGTLAKHTERSPYDESRVHEDLPHMDIFNLVNMLCEDHRIIVMSGRSAACRTATEDWLLNYLDQWTELLMRPEGDTRMDAIVKLELFDKFVRNTYDVKYVFDDRNQVVEMWRALGLRVLQVAEGDF